MAAMQETAPFIIAASFESFRRLLPAGCCRVTTPLSHHWLIRLIRARPPVLLKICLKKAIIFFQRHQSINFVTFSHGRIGALMALADKLFRAAVKVNRVLVLLFTLPRALSVECRVCRRT
jgi:hypothetical protein